MKYSEAIKIATKNPEFARIRDLFEAAVKNQHVNGSIQFSLGSEAFYYAGEAAYNEETGEYEYLFNGGKHTARRAAYMIGAGATLKIEQA